jgi:predicted dehydrogenase
VLVEKPLLAADNAPLVRLKELARSTGAACYTAYNHRFEPHLVRLKEVMERQTLGKLYLARFFYGNGTAQDVKRSPWRDQGTGVLADLGSHLLDMVLFLFGPRPVDLKLWRFDRFENRACDHFCFGSEGRPVVELEATLLSWRNAFTADVFGELGSAHVDCLCKWGPSTFTLRQRVFPSGRPPEQVQRLEAADPTWALEYASFKGLCATGGTNLDNDLWINSALNHLARQAGEEVRG